MPITPNLRHSISPVIIRLELENDLSGLGTEISLTIRLGPCIEIMVGIFLQIRPADVRHTV